MLSTQLILQGHVLDVIGDIPDEFFDCIITSPPYWGLRDYGLEPQIWDAVGGCEHEWGNELLTGEGYSSGSRKRWQHKQNRGDNPENWQKETSQGQFCSLCGAWRGSLGLEPTFQLYIQHLMRIMAECKRVLKKTGCCFVNMGDSYGGWQGKHHSWNDNKQTVEERGVAQHSKSHMPAKSLCQIPSRFSIAMTDAGWILRNEIIWYKRNCMPSSAKDRFTVNFEKVFFFVKNKKYWFKQQREGNNHYKTIAKVGQKRFGGNTAPGSATIRADRVIETVGRNKRCVWDVTTKPFKEAHFAVFPPELIEPMLSAGCPIDGWVLDPFAGAGTVGVVAKAQDKNFIGVELNPDYCEMADKRIG